MMRSTLQPTLFQTSAGTDTFQLQLENRFDALAPTLDIDEDFENMVNILRDESIRFCRKRHRGSRSKLSEETLELTKERRESSRTNATPSELHARTKKIRRLIRRDFQSSRPDILPEVEDFYSRLYVSQKPQPGPPGQGSQSHINTPLHRRVSRSQLRGDII
ncbi:unnamed protein product [Euphydryas editha]|uniref:Uncharacterized protein n=1 Tax=Euphydryas editha TaxID=104508 RepID=A0AAU9V466_EUPED|nr:unnamed protein product [Euphydryas editha]